MKRENIFNQPLHSRPIRCPTQGYSGCHASIEESKHKRHSGEAELGTWSLLMGEEEICLVSPAFFSLFMSSLHPIQHLTPLFPFNELLPLLPQWDTAGQVRLRLGSWRPLPYFLFSSCISPTAPSLLTLASDLDSPTPLGTLSIPCTICQVQLGPNRPFF